MTETNGQNELAVGETNGQIELAIVKGPTSGVFKLDHTGLTLAEDTSYDQWIEGLKWIKWARTKLSIGFADSIAFGRRKFGADKVERALEQLEFEATFVKTALAIDSVPRELRFENLLGEHYVELSKSDLSKDRMIEWARVASEQHLTPSQLKFSMAEGQVVTEQAARSLQSGVVTIHGIRQQFDVWLSRVGGVDGILGMDADHQEEIASELELFVYVGNQVLDHVHASQA